MSTWDDHERRKQRDRDRERRQAEQRAREKRRQWEMEMTRSVSDNPEALRVIHGLEDPRLNDEILGLTSDLPIRLDDPDLDAYVVDQITSLIEDAALTVENKQWQALMWLAGGLDNRIQRIENALAATPPTEHDRKRRLSSNLHALRRKYDLVKRHLDDLQEQSHGRLLDAR
ncbi:MAG: hypothetical protein ACE5G0_04285 [Rhodothermales bacterium]